MSERQGACEILKSERFSLRTLKTSISLSFEMKLSNGCDVRIGFCDQITFGNPGLKITSRALILTDSQEGEHSDS